MHISSLIKINGENSEIVIVISDECKDYAFSVISETTVPTDQLSTVLSGAFRIALKNYVTDSGFIPDFYIICNSAEFANKKLIEAPYAEVARIFIRSCGKLGAKRALSEFENRLRGNEFSSWVKHLPLGCSYNI